MKLAVVIPTYKYHIPLLKTVLESIVGQTCLPDLVLIRASSCHAESSAILAGLRAATWPFALMILETEKLQHVAENKNAAIATLPEDIDIVSFFDSDDVMHPRRIEYVKQYISNGYDGVYHGYTSSSEFNLMEEPRAAIDTYIKKETVSDAFSGAPFTIRRLIFLDEEDTEVGYHDGSVSLRKECFTKVQYDETAKGHQDCLFASDLHDARYRLVNLGIPLMQYIEVSLEEKSKKNADVC
jgi:glycosyltransferase involved in cell wall biosynthesis